MSELEGGTLELGGRAPEVGGRAPELEGVLVLELVSQTNHGNIMRVLDAVFSTEISPI